MRNINIERAEDGKLKKGTTLNPNGRPKGAVNKSTKELRQVVENFLNNNIETIQSDFDSLEPKERLDTIIKLLDFALPKLQRTAVHHTIDDKEITQITRVIVEPKN